MDEEDVTRERRHFGWLNDAPDLRGAITLRSVEMFREQGRGAWFGSAVTGNGEVSSLTYMTLDWLRENPDHVGEIIEELERYDPLTAAVVVIEDVDFVTSFYRLATVTVEAN